MKVGFIGLGQMGSGMAANLLRAGHEVTVYNRTVARTASLAAQGARVAGSIADACKGQVVITMLADDVALGATVFGEGSVLETLGAGAVHISMSTIGVALSEHLSQAHESAGQKFIAAPVFGRPDAAAAAKLAIVVGGSNEAVQRVEPLFAAMGQAMFRISERPRDANLLKICGNFMIGSALEAMGEAVALMRKAGVPGQTLIDVLTATVFNAPVYRNYGDIIAAEKYSPAGFTAPLGYKDVGLALEAAEALRVPMPLASLLSDRLLRLLAEGGEDLDWAAIARLSAADAGLR